MLTPYELDLVRTAADVTATAAVTVGLPTLGGWAVRRGLIQQRWVAVIEAAAGAALNAGRIAGPIDSPAFRQAAEQAILAYAKTQASDVLRSKRLTDELTVQAGMARLSRLTDGAVGPAGAASPAA